jgi:hypothetical protein
MSINQWRVYCTTENAWVSGWVSSTDPTPTTCFNNNTHTINQSSQQILTSTQLVTTKIIQETVPTGGHYSCQGFTFNIAPSTTDNILVSWPFPITTTVVHVQPLLDNVGDTLDAIVSPRTLVGAIGANVAIGDITAVVSTTVISNAAIGFDFYIDSEHVGRILEIYPTTSTIKFETPATIAHTAGTLLYLELRIIRNFPLGCENGNDLGAASLGGKYLPAGTVTKIIYTNNSTVTKTFRFSIEYLF